MSELQKVYVSGEAVEATIDFVKGFVNTPGEAFALLVTVLYTLDKVYSTDSNQSLESVIVEFLLQLRNRNNARPH